MSDETMTLDRLDEVDECYAYYRVGGEDGGSLIVGSTTGSSLLVPYDGRWTALEAVESRDDAVDAARAWEAAR